jgi:hypothetical protein
MAYARDLKRYDRILKPEEDMRVMGAGGGAPAPLAGAPPAPINPQASSASGFVSFDQRLNANQGAADAMAGRVAGNTQKAAEKAKGQLGQVQQTFNEQLQGGSLQAPPAPKPAGNTTLSAAQGTPPPGQPAASVVPAGMVRGGSPYNQILQSGGAMTAAPTLPTAGRTLAPTGTALRQIGAPPIGGDSMRRVLSDREKSQVAYSGPDSLRGVEGFDALERATLDADSRLGATRDNAGREQLVADAYAGSRTGGGSALDAALTGAAGGERFAQLRRNYGSLGKLLSEADVRSQAQADAARASTADAAKAYGVIADKADADQKARDEAAKAAQIASEARAAELARQAALPRQQQTAATADRRGVSDMTTTIGEERQAQMDGLWQEWLKAGSPPYEEWKASREAGG